MTIFGMSKGGRIARMFVAARLQYTATAWGTVAVRSDCATIMGKLMKCGVNNATFRVILFEAPRYSPELIYAHHPRGFCLVSTRSSEVQRLYFQCDPSDSVDNWPDRRIWDELDARLVSDNQAALFRGRIFQKGIIQMRSYVCEPMRFNSVFLAGDAAHIVPPTGAKGLNLAMADVCLLADAFDRYYETGATDGLDAYSEHALARVWAAQHFSWWMTSLLHHFPDSVLLQEKLQLAQLREIVASRSLQTGLAERYVGKAMTGRVPAMHRNEGAGEAQAYEH